MDQVTPDHVTAYPHGASGRWAVVVCTLLAIMLMTGCGGRLSQRDCGLAPHSPLAGALRGDSLAPVPATEFFLRFFGDSLDSQVRYLLAPDSNRTNEQLVLEALHSRDIAAYTMSPASWESIYATASLPVLVAVSLQRFSSAKATPKSVKSLARHPFVAIPSSPGAEPEIQIIARIGKSGAAYEAVTAEGLRLRGFPSDAISGQIVPPSSTKGPNSRYVQIIGITLLSRAPLPLIRQHVDEWFKDLPYTFSRPEIEER